MDLPDPNRAQQAHDRDLVGGRVLRVQIEVEVGSEPLRGRVQGEGGELVDFHGILELVALLDGLSDIAQRPDAGPR